MKTKLIILAVALVCSAILFAEVERRDTIDFDKIKNISSFMEGNYTITLTDGTTYHWEKEGQE